MNKFKIIMAVLAVVGSTALVNCSEFQGNNSTPGDGPALNSEAPEPGNELDEQAQAYRQKMEYRNGITSDLRRIGDRSFAENLCSQADQDALANQEEVINMGSRVLRMNPPLERIMDQTQTVQQVQFAVDALVRILRNSDNHHCAMNVAAETARFGISGLMENPAINYDMDTSEAATQRYENMVAKADHIRDGLLPLVNDLQSEINADIREPWLEMAATHESLVSQIGEKSMLLGQMIELIRASYTCNDALPNCSLAERARGTVVVRTEADIVAAQEAAGSFQIQEPGDSRLTQDRLDILESHDRILDGRLESLTNIVRAIENEQGATGTSEEAP